MRAIVADANLSSAVAGLRALGRAGIPTVAVGPTRSAPGLWSRWATERAVCPDPVTRPDAFAEALGDLIDGSDPGFVYPGREETVDALLDATADQLRDARSPYPDADATRRIRDKRLLPELAGVSGLVAPATRAHVTGAELRDAVTELPVVVKPAAPGGALRTFCLVECEADLDRVAAKVAPEDQLLIQEHVPGSQVALALVVDGGGRVVERFQHAVLRTYPAEGGGTSLAVSMAPDEELVAGAAHMLHQAGYSGFAHLDLVTARGGFCLLDVNPRFYTSLPLATHCGVNLPEAWHRVLLGDTSATNRPYRSGVGYRWLDADVRSLGRYQRARGGGAGALWDPTDPLPSALMAGRVAVFDGGRALARRGAKRLSARTGPSLAPGRESKADRRIPSGRGAACDPPSVHAEYLPGGVFSLRHEPDPARAAPTAVVLVPPFGSEEVASYRERRWLARQLSDAGYPTLRIDLPTTGDSVGAAVDADRLGAWGDAVAQAAQRMRAERGRVAVVALGLGGLAAIHAASQGALIDDLVLWAVPATGRAAARRLGSLARLQPNRGPDESPLPEGWLEVGGYLLDAATLEQLAGVDLTASALGAVERVLLLGRDGEPAGEALAEAWRSKAVHVEMGPGDGYDAMLEHPQRTNPPKGVAERLLDWLAAAPAGGAAPVPASVGSAKRLVVAGGAEEPFELAGPQGRIFGVLGQPDRPGEGTCLVLLNAGAQRRTGPNRMWVETARRWVAEGVPTLRVDLAAIGDSDGDDSRLRDDAGLYRPEALDDVRAVLDELERRDAGSRFVLAGLCSGAYASFHLGATDPRVCAVGLLNPQALVWADDLAARREARKLRRITSRQGWTAFLSGEISTAAIVSSARVAARLIATRLVRRGRAPDPTGVTSVADGLDRLRASGTPVLLGFSDQEPLVADLEADGTRSRLDRWPNVTWVDLPGQDHELRPIQAQRAGRELLDRAVAAGISPPLSAPQRRRA